MRTGIPIHWIEGAVKIIKIRYRPIQMVTTFCCIRSAGAGQIAGRATKTGWRSTALRQ